MVDLHSHSDRSDGTLSPEELAGLARRSGLQALSITDHDTIEGYEAAAPHARRLGLQLICGIELSAKFRDRSVHILGYFLEGPPGKTFRDHLACLQKARRERNVRLTKRLQQLGLSIRLEDVEQLGGRQTGRPHFAQALIRKGYVSSMREAFDRYLDESAPGYVERRDPSLENVLRWIDEAGGISSWAHPARFLREAGFAVEEIFEELKDRGLRAVEVHHTDHLPEEVELFRLLAKRLSLGITGGSDFHGGGRSRARLGGLNLPWSLLEELRAFSREVVSGKGSPQDSRL